MLISKEDVFILVRVVSGVGWCRVVGLAETITNSVKLKLKMRLSLATKEVADIDKKLITSSDFHALSDGFWQMVLQFF